MSDQYWVVFDIETSGLKRDKDQILECAAIHVNPADLSVLGSISWLVTHRELAPMDDFVQAMHTKSGLIADLAKDRDFLSATGQLASDAHAWLDRILVEYFATICGVDSTLRNAPPRSVVLIGNSIHFDRGFLEHYCPAASQYLFHRMIDVSCLRTLYAAWVGNPPVTEMCHRALGDCDASLATLRWYAKNIFSNSQVP